MEIPIDWKMGIVFPIYKKGDRNKCDSYRAVTLRSCMYKVPSSIISNRWTECAEKVIGDYQNRFRMRRRTVDNIHTLRQIIEKAFEYNIQIGTVFRF
jgi:hypothetical protein